MSRCLCLPLLCVAMMGCQAESKSAPASEVVGVWLPSGAAQFIEQERGPDGTLSENHPLIAEILAEHEIAVEFRYKGIAVPFWQAERAREVLLTDARLRGRDIHVSLFVPAGTAEMRDEGILLPSIASLRSEAVTTATGDSPQQRDEAKP